MNKILSKNKVKISMGIVLTALFFGTVVFMKDNSKAQEGEISPEEKIISVKTQKAGELKSISGQIKYPATVLGDQEATITAGSSGVIRSLNFDLGSAVFSGQVLAKIDDLGSNLSQGRNGLKSGEVQQLDLARRQAKESLELAEQNYKKNKSFANKTARDIAKRQYESAKVALAGALDARAALAPFSGTITSRQVNLGDSVSQGQIIATISKTDRKKIQFFSDTQSLENIKIGTKITVKNNDNKESAAKITNISPGADPLTRRFLIEAMPDDSRNFLIGTIVNVLVESNQEVVLENSFILPLSALTIAQNETYFFIVEDGKAKKNTAEIALVNGETAQIKSEISPDALIIVEGNKLLQEGDKLIIAK